MKRLIIICTGNSCRSQMAHGLLNSLNLKIEVYSAGTKPEKVNQFAVVAMNKIGIDISKYLSNSVDEYISKKFDFVITLCDNAKDICPTFVNAKIFCHKHFLDPANAKGSNKEKQVIYDNVRNELRKYFFDFSKKEFI